MIRKSNLTIRAMSESDYSYMAKWLNDDLVVEYYSPRLTLEEVIAKYGPRINNEHYVMPCIVEYKDEPIGYIQYYRTPKEQLEIYGYPVEESVYGIDQFIGEPSLWGKGIGTQMISSLLDYMNSRLGVKKVVLNVKSSNNKAINCYKKSGFRFVKKLEHNYSLMEWEIP